MLSPVVEEGDQPLDEVSLAGAQAPLQIIDVAGEVHLVYGPAVLDRITIHLVEAWVAEGSQAEAKAGVEQARRSRHRAHWQAPQLSGFSSEQLTAAAASPSASAFRSTSVSGSVATVAFAMRVAARDRRSMRADRCWGFRRKGSASDSDR